MLLPTQSEFNRSIQKCKVKYILYHVKQLEASDEKEINGKIT